MNIKLLSLTLGLVMTVSCIKTVSNIQASTETCTDTEHHSCSDDNDVDVATAYLTSDSKNWGADNCIWSEAWGKKNKRNYL
jgi:hypothetical protein